MEKTLKHSAKRDTLYSLLQSVKSHPTAEWLYMKMKDKYPSISMATVYRNLRQMQDMGDVITIDCGDGVEHFDATVCDHAHFVCNKCHRVIDIELPQMSTINSIVEENNSIKVEKNNLVFYGLCENCK